MPMMNPAHPGECLRDDVLASGMTQAQVAARLGMNRSNLHRLMTGQIAMTAKTALALEAMGWGRAEHWLRLQNAYDLARARRAASEDHAVRETAQRAPRRKTASRALGRSAS